MYAQSNSNAMILFLLLFNNWTTATIHQWQKTVNRWRRTIFEKQQKELKNRSLTRETISPEIICSNFEGYNAWTHGTATGNRNHIKRARKEEKNGKIFEKRFLVYEAEFPNLENGLSSLGEQIFLSIERNFSFGHFGDFSSERVDALLKMNKKYEQI